MFLFVLNFLGGYLVGSLPTAYLIVRKQSAVDIRTAGSGNVGGFNAFQVTQSKRTGILVGVIDGLKGLAVALIALSIAPDSFWLPAVALMGAIAGHNYPVWLQFKGGRGLATAAGGFFVIGSIYTIVWCTVWLLAKRWRSDILAANVIAIIVTPLLLIVFPSTWIESFMMVQGDRDAFVLFAVLLSAELLLSHKDFLRGLMKKVTAQRNPTKS